MNRDEAKKNPKCPTQKKLSFSSQPILNISGTGPWVSRINLMQRALMWRRPFWIFFFKKRIFFSSLFKSVTIYGVPRKGQNYPGFQQKS
jgi:hypothetical protein